MGNPGGARRAWARIVGTHALVMVALALFGCDSETSADQGAVGFDVRETMSSNTCGPQSMSLLSVLQYQATVLVRGNSLTWSVPASRIRASGLYVADTREFQLSAEGYITLRDADRTTGRAACVLRRLDVIDGVLSGDPTPPASGDAGVDADAEAQLDGGPVDAGAVDAGAYDGAATEPVALTFDATETIVYGPVQGADCSDMIGASDGQYSTLPCQVEYRVTGVPTAGQ